jgi:HK97 family phage prohead protease
MTQALEHKIYTAEPVITDQGIFEALVSTPAEDRERDMVETGAFKTTIAAWQASGKMIPLAWDHGTDPESIVGSIDPDQMREEAGKGLIHGGQVDLETDRGRQVWRLLKSGSLGFSFAYLITDSVDRPGGGREIRSLDLFEVSATTAPMNSGTRVLSTKAVDERAEAIRQEAYEVTLKHLNAAAPPAKRLDEMSLAELKARGEELTKDIDLRPPPQIVSFEC